MRTYLAAGLSGLLLTACHGAQCAETDPQALRAEPAEISVYAARRLAIDEVYTRHPARALVDFANVEQTATSPAAYAVHVEMTGAPDARAIYDVVVTEAEPGKLSVTGFTKAQ